MDHRNFITTLPALTVLAEALPGHARRPGRRQLPSRSLSKPEKDGGKSVLAAPARAKDQPQRQRQELPEQVLSNLLWAALE